MLPPQSATTNKVLAGAVGLEYNLSPAQLDDLCGKNVVTFRSKAGRIVITDGVTSAGHTSDFTRLSTVRIVNEAVQAIRTVADPFIGEPNDLPQQNALNTAIKSALDAMVKAGALRAFKFNLSSTLQDYIDGKMSVEVTLVPAFELRKITTTVALKPTL
jgi:phage tail sheath protein FI